MIGRRDDAGRDLDALRPLARGAQKHLGRADHLPAARMVLAAPEFFVPELVQVLDEIEIAAELQHRVLPDGMVRSEECAKVQTRHRRVSWVVMISDSTS